MKGEKKEERNEKEREEGWKLKRQHKTNIMRRRKKKRKKEGRVDRVYVLVCSIHGKQHVQY